MRLTMVHKYFIFWRPLPFTLKAALYLEAPGSNCPEDRPDNSKTRFPLTFNLDIPSPNQICMFCVRYCTT